MSTLTAHEKGGVVVKGSALDSLGKTVTGLGRVDFVAQNGIEYALGAKGKVSQNTITGYFYTGGQGLLANGDQCGPA